MRLRLKRQSSISCLERNLQEEMFWISVGIDLVKKSGAWYAYEGEKIGQDVKMQSISDQSGGDGGAGQKSTPALSSERKEEEVKSDLKLTPKEEQMELSIEGEE